MREMRAHASVATFVALHVVLQISVRGLRYIIYDLSIPIYCPLEKCITNKELLWNYMKGFK